MCVGGQIGGNVLGRVKLCNYMYVQLRILTHMHARMCAYVSICILCVCCFGNPITCTCSHFRQRPTHTKNSTKMDFITDMY